MGKQKGPGHFPNQPQTLGTTVIFRRKIEHPAPVARGFPPGEVICFNQSVLLWRVPVNQGLLQGVGQFRHVMFVDRAGGADPSQRPALTSQPGRRQQTCEISGRLVGN